MFFGNSCYNWVFRVSLIRAERILCPGHCNTVVIPGTTLGAHQIIIVSPSGQVRRFQTPAIRSAAPDAFGVTYDCPGLRIILHEANLTGFFVAGTGFPIERHQPLSPIRVMQQRGIKAGGMEIYRLTPRPPDIFCSNNIVIDVKIPCIHGIHDAIDYIEEVFLLAIGQAGRPDPLRRRKPRQIAGLFICKRMRIQFPVFHIPGMVNGDAGKPFKAGNRDIIVVSFTADAGISMKSGKNRIFDQHENVASYRKLNIPNWQLCRTGCQHTKLRVTRIKVP